MLVVLEGIDGSGKTTLVQNLVRALKERGVSALATREPTDGPEGSKLREAAARGHRFGAEEELQLFMSDRERHVRDVVRPALERGDVVVQDRTFYSTAAYQGLRGLDRDEILKWGRKVAPEPDRLLVLDLPVDLALARVEGRGAGTDPFEQQRALEEIRAFFAGLERARVLDATLPQAELLERALQAMDQG